MPHAPSLGALDASDCDEPGNQDIACSEPPTSTVVSADGVVLWQMNSNWTSASRIGWVTAVTEISLTFISL